MLQKSPQGFWVVLVGELLFFIKGILVELGEI